MVFELLLSGVVFILSSEVGSIAQVSCGEWMLKGSGILEGRKWTRNGDFTAKSSSEEEYWETQL